MLFEDILMISVAIFGMFYSIIKAFTVRRHNCSFICLGLLFELIFVLLVR